jgi:hypothetical protein
MSCIFMCNVKKKHNSIALQTTNSYKTRHTSLVNYGYTMTSSVPLKSSAQGLIHSDGRLMCLKDSTKVYNVGKVIRNTN